MRHCLEGHAALVGISLAEGFVWKFNLYGAARILCHVIRREGPGVGSFLSDLPWVRVTAWLPKRGLLRPKASKQDHRTAG